MKIEMHVFPIMDLDSNWDNDMLLNFLQIINLSRLCNKIGYFLLNSICI